jgi:hypothetical protein
MYNQDFSENRPPSLDQVRSFVLQLWPKLFSPAEKAGITGANSLDDRTKIGFFRKITIAPAGSPHSKLV